MRVVVLGAGVTGLALGYRLIERLRAAGRADEVLVLEAAPRPGGHADTTLEDGWLVEGGPNGFLDRPREPELRALAGELGLGARLCEARSESKRRYILLGGRLRAVPGGPPSLISTDLLSAGGKLRLALEPFARRAPAGVEESVYDFAARRIGREAAENLVDVAISGISAGDSRALSVEAAFPVMTEMEREHGSLVAAMIARRRQPVPRLFSFDGGLAVLTQALAGRLGSALRTGAPVARLAPAGRAWRVELEGGESVTADHVVPTVAAHRAAALLAPADPELAAALERIPYAGIAMVALGYRTADVPRALDGYGYLVANGEGLDTLGVVWESSLFAGRAPEGHVLLRCMLGGARRPGVAERAVEELVARARAELAPVLGVTAEPARVWVRRWPRAMAQYTLGHRERVAAARALAARHPGLHLVGTSYDGISITAGVAAAEAWVPRFLDSPPGGNGRRASRIEAMSPARERVEPAARRAP